MSNTAEKLGNENELILDSLLEKLWYNIEEIDKKRVNINNAIFKTSNQSQAICTETNNTDIPKSGFAYISNQSYIDSSNICLAHLINNLERRFDNTPFNTWIYEEIENYLTPKNGSWGYSKNDLKITNIYTMFLFVHLHPVIETWVNIHPEQGTAYKKIRNRVKSAFYIKETYPDEYSYELTPLEKEVKELL